MFEIFSLSLIQGLTEFLPVSSSGHLILLPTLLGWQDHSLEIDGILHFGTLCSVCCYFYKDIFQMIRHFFGYYLKLGRSRDPFHARLAFTIIIATFPVVIAGFLLKRIGIEVVRSPSINAVMLILGGIFLYAADRFAQKNQTLQGMTFGKALIIGLFQVISLIPGSSRSGMCLTGARLLGFDRVSATRYAFLLAIPAILGASLLIFMDASKEGIQTPLLDLSLYFSLSFLFGLAAIHFMITFLQRHSLLIFALYRIFLGGIILWLL